jgi:GNAT acetyltransferase-like protein
MTSVDAIVNSHKPPALDLIARTIATEDAYTLSRMRVLERIPGNPIGIAYRVVDEGVTAVMARYLPSPSFNSVRGLRAGHQRHIAPLVAWYRDHGVKARFELVPGYYHESLGRELHRLGYYASEFHTSLIAEAGSAPPARDITIERVADKRTMEEYLDAYLAGWGFPESEHARFKTNVRPWLGQLGWSLYLARIDGRPAATATLFLNNDVGYFADSTTARPMRGRGLHTALLVRRWRDAHEAGADIVCSGAAFLSTGHRNMERIGMRTQFTRTIWTECPPTS